VMHGVDVSGGRLSVALRMAHFKPCPDPESKSGVVPIHLSLWHVS
jgi:hypothetical protein